MLKKNFLHYDFNQFKKFRFKKKFDLIICLDTIYYAGNSTCISCNGQGAYLTDEGKCDCHGTYLKRLNNILFNK